MKTDLRIELHTCKYCGIETDIPDESCYKNPDRERPMERIEITGQPEPLSEIERLKEEILSMEHYIVYKGFEVIYWKDLKDILGRY